MCSSDLLHFGYEHYHGMNPAVYSIATGERELGEVQKTDLPQGIQKLGVEDLQAHMKRMEKIGRASCRERV